jgi:hypothetical protein
MSVIYDIRTLEDLAIERAKYGVARITFDYSLDFLQPVQVVLWVERYDQDAQTYRGSGDNEVEAIDDAFARLKHVRGAALREAIKES